MVELPLNVPEGTRSVRLTLTLPAEMAFGLSDVARRIGVSRSALVTALLSNSVPNMTAVLDEFPEPEGVDVQSRLRGRSVELVLERVARVMQKF